MDNPDWKKELATLVGLGKRMRAVQHDFFRTRNMQTLRTAKKLETEFDNLLEEMEKKIDE